MNNNTDHRISAATRAYAQAADSNPLIDSQAYYNQSWEEMTLAELASRKGHISRVRWIGNEFIPGRGRCWDLSYIHAELPDGTAVRINRLPAARLIPKHSMKGELITWAKQQGVFAKGIGLLDTARWSILS